MNKRQWNLRQTTKLFIHEQAFENVVCKMVVILCRGRWVNQRNLEKLMAHLVVSIVAADGLVPL